MNHMGYRGISWSGKFNKVSWDFFYAYFKMQISAFFCQISWKNIVDFNKNIVMEHLPNSKDPGLVIFDLEETFEENEGEMEQFVRWHTW